MGLDKRDTSFNNPNKCSTSLDFPFASGLMISYPPWQQSARVSRTLVLGIKAQRFSSLQRNKSFCPWKICVKSCVQDRIVKNSCTETDHTTHHITHSLWWSQPSSAPSFSSCPLFVFDRQFVSPILNSKYSECKKDSPVNLPLDSLHTSGASIFYAAVGVNLHSPPRQPQSVCPLDTWLCTHGLQQSLLLYTWVKGFCR